MPLKNKNKITLSEWKPYNSQGQELAWWGKSVIFVAYYIFNVSTGQNVLTNFSEHYIISEIPLLVK